MAVDDYLIDGVGVHGGHDRPAAGGGTALRGDSSGGGAGYTRDPCS